MRIGYARCSSESDDLHAQREALIGLGAEPDRLYTDVGLRGANNPRPGLREVLAACRAADTLVVTGLDRLARSLPDARDIVGELSIRQVASDLVGTVHDPADPVGRQLSVVLGLVADFETALNRGRTIEGMKLARVKGRLKGKPPKLRPRQEAHLVQLFEAGEHTTTEIAELMGVSRSTVYRAVKRAQARQRRP